MKKKQSIDFPTMEYKLSNGITLLICAWIKGNTKSRRFNSPIIGYNETDWRISIELKIGKGSGIYYNPTLAIFSNGHSENEVKTLLKGLGIENSVTYQSLLIQIRALRDCAVNMAKNW